MNFIYRLTIFSLLIITTAFTFSQEEAKLDLRWYDETVITNDDTTYVQNCESCNLNKDLQPYIIHSITGDAREIVLSNIESDFVIYI